MDGTFISCVSCLSGSKFCMVLLTDSTLFSWVASLGEESTKLIGCFMFSEEVTTPEPGEGLK